MANVQVKEINIEITTGTLAAKWWGSMDKRPILMLHGWQDNAGSFDLLIPLLPTNYSYLAIDFPGHGLSSHHPKGHFYHICDYGSILDEIRIKFKWEKLSFIGHSMGASVASIYASLYPTQVDLLVALDSIRPPPIKKISLFLVRRHLEIAYKFNNDSDHGRRQQNQEYTYDQMKKMKSASSIDPNKVIYLLKRGSKASKRHPNKFQFTNDTRINFIQPFCLDHENSLYFLKKIQSPYLYIKTDDLTFEEDPTIFAETLDAVHKHNPKFEMMKVNGTHHVHLNNPEIMADKISDFIKMHHIEEQSVNCTQPMSKM